MTRFDATDRRPVDKWTAAPRPTTSPQGQKPQQKRSTHMVHKPVNSRFDATDRRPVDKWTAAPRPTTSCGAVQCTPRRLDGVESLVKGETPNEELETLIKRVASSGAKPLNFNHFKIPMMNNLAARAIRSLA